MKSNERLLLNRLIIQTANYYGKIYDENVLSGILEFYWEDLQNYELEDIRKALILHRHEPKHGKYMPKTVDIIKHLSKPQVKRIGSCDYAGCKNPYEFALPVIENGCDSGKRTNVCEEHFEKYHWKKTEPQKEFEKRLAEQMEKFKTSSSPKDYLERSKMKETLDTLGAKLAVSTPGRSRDPPSG